MRLPSTRMIWCCGSTLAPNLRTISPSTSTRPAPISSSQCRLLPTPGGGQHLLQPDAAGHVGERVALARRPVVVSRRSQGRQAGRRGPGPARSAALSRRPGPARPALAARARPGAALPAARPGWHRRWRLPAGVMARIQFVVEMIGQERRQVRQVGRGGPGRAAPGSSRSSGTGSRRSRDRCPPPRPGRAAPACASRRRSSRRAPPKPGPG